MKRGDLVTVAVQGDYGKPRPAVVVQSDLLTEYDAQSVVLCLVTSDIEDVKTFRINVKPSSSNGLQKISQVMVDKLFTVQRGKIGKVLGSLTRKQLQELDRQLAFVVGLA